MKYIAVTKPGIIFGNIVTVTGGFLLASQGQYHWLTLLYTLISMSLIIASGCVFNNIIDQDIDKLMERTKNRVMVHQALSNKKAFIYAVILGIAGLSFLYISTSLLTTIVAFVGLFFYVNVYTLWLKRRSTYGTIIGGIAGAIPPVVGYCAVSNTLDLGAFLVFLILFLWQIPHFYAISIYRLEDYQNAGIPILPVKKSMLYTKISMLVYVLVFTFTALMPTLYGYTGLAYFCCAAILGLIWIGLSIQGLNTSDNKTWARKVFSFSVLNITLLSIFMAF